MSAWMITTAHADFIATAYLQFVDGDADPQAIGKELLQENVNSLAARYGDRSDQPQVDSYRFRRWLGNIDPANANKQARCADYQACEHSEWEHTAAFRQLQRLIDATGGSEAKLDEAYPWGIDEHPISAQPAPAPQPIEDAAPAAEPHFHELQTIGTVRAILIDPEARTVTAGYQQKGLYPIYATLRCSCFDICDLGPDQMGAPVSLYCDDEGRFKEAQSCFKIGGRLIAGRALLLSHDRDGETVGTQLDLARAAAAVQWLDAGTDYTPPEPTVIGFSSWDMLKFI